MRSGVGRRESKRATRGLTENIDGRLFMRENPPALSREALPQEGGCSNAASSAVGAAPLGSRNRNTVLVKGAAPKVIISTINRFII